MYGMKNLTIAISIPLLLVALFLLYSPGISSGFFFDDYPHLAGLSSVIDSQTALTYVTESNAGPLQRPISFATLLISAPCYPDNPDCFIYENILIHLLNTILVFWFSWKLLAQTRTRINIKSPITIALIATGFWAVMPINAATTLIVIQRMTSLSAMLVLIGLILYLYGREKLIAQRTHSLMLMGLGVIVGAGISSFAKENGVLFPFFLIVMEMTLLTQPLYKRETICRLFFIFSAVLPVIIILVYIGWTFPKILDSYQYRSFGMSERLLTEPRVLWLYIKLLLFPRTLEIAPFYDGFVASDSILNPLSTLTSIIGWIVVVSVSFKIRKVYPSLLFGISWFFAGHFLEAGVHSLELVFLHRNYVPSIGLVLGLAVAIVQYLDTTPYKNLSMAITAVYACFLAAVLWNTTSLWGEVSVSARIWQKTFPDSSRAAQYLSRDYISRKDVAQAVETIIETWQRHPERSDMAMQAVQMSCYREKPDRSIYQKVLSDLETTEFSYSAVDTIDKLIFIIQKGECRFQLEYQDVEKLINKLTENPSFYAINLQISKLLKYKSKIYFMQGRSREGAAILEKALLYSNILDDYIQLAQLYISTGNQDKAEQVIETAISRAPINPLRRDRWMDQIEKELGKLGSQDN